MKKFMTVALIASGAVIAALGSAGSANAATPAEQACLGSFLSTSAQQFGGGFGQRVAFFAGPISPLPVDNYGQAIQNLQAGTALPPYDEVCNTPE